MKYLPVGISWPESGQILTDSDSQIDTSTRSLSDFGANCMFTVVYRFAYYGYYGYSRI